MSEQRPPLPFDAGLKQAEQEDLDQGLRRSLQRSPAGAVSFANNDYLGLRGHPALRAAADRAARDFGVGSGSSRLVAGSYSLIEELETRLAAFKGYESALVYPTGYQAAIGTISALVGPSDEVILDKLAHASLIDGARLSGARIRTFRHLDCAHLATQLAKPCSGRRLVITEGVFSMDGDIAPLPEVGSLCAEHRAALLVDEAHATGCLGSSGRGAAQELGAEELVQISMGTLSKALGSQGGFVCASRTVTEHLVNHSRSFIYTTALAPGLAGAALAALDLVSSEPERRERLRSASARLREDLQECGFDTGASATQIVPTMIGRNEDALAASAWLAERGYHCPAIRYPTVPRGGARLRISLTSEHEPEQIAGLVAGLREWDYNRDC